MQKNPCVEQCVIDIFDLMSLQCALKKNLDTINILYVALCSKDKSVTNVYDLLCDLITNINYRNIDQLFDIAIKMLVDRYLDWSRPNRNSYLVVLTLFTKMDN